MIVAVSRIPLPKTERYLYWVRVALRSPETVTVSGLLFFARMGAAAGFLTLF